MYSISPVVLKSHSKMSLITPASLLKGFPGGSEVKASACNAGDLGSIPGSGRSPGEGNGNPIIIVTNHKQWLLIVVYFPSDLRGKGFTQ